MKRAPLVASAVTAVVVVGSLAAYSTHPEEANANVQRDTDNCASGAEYERIEDGMSVNTVRNIFDVDGRYRDAGDDTFAYAFLSCSGNSRFIIVFSSASGLAINKRIVDLD